jgi:hypothetical protein
MKNKTYSWNRNTTSHRIAATKFSVYAFIQAVALSLIVILGMGIASDGTREYIVTTAMLGLLAMEISFVVFYVMMMVMYRWVLEVDEKGKIPPTLPHKEVYYQDKAGNFTLAPQGEKWGRGKQ